MKYDLANPKNTVGKPNPVGRPRTVSPPPDELEALGVEMIQWLLSHPDALHVSEWYSLEKFFVDDVWECMIRCKEFSGYYEQAKRIIGKKYLDKTSNVREGASQRWQRVYFKDLKNQEDEDAKFNAELSKEVDKTLPDYYIQLNEKLRQELAEARQSLSERKRADTSIINDNKS